MGFNSGFKGLMIPPQTIFTSVGSSSPHSNSKLEVQGTPNCFVTRLKPV